MAAMMVVGSNPRIMGRLTLNLGLKIVGWAATLVMGAAAVGLFLT
jgi:Mn2+/Fe2+ NRAMP family transporter